MSHQSSNAEKLKVEVRAVVPSDIGGIIDLCTRVYVDSPPWSRPQIESQLKVFPQGQIVAIDSVDQKIVGYAASLVVNWDEYNFDDSWKDFTEAGYFTNHDLEGGKTLYGAEVMVDPTMQGRSVGSQIYRARRKITEALGLYRIRAGARLRSYHKFADEMSPQKYVKGVVQGDLYDPTLSFQLKQGFKVLGVVGEYLRHDPESQGYAAVIEWLNPKAARPDHFSVQKKSPYYRDEFSVKKTARRGTGKRA